MQIKSRQTRSQYTLKELIPQHCKSSSKKARICLLRIRFFKNIFTALKIEVIKSALFSHLWWSTLLVIRSTVFKAESSWTLSCSFVYSWVIILLSQVTNKPIVSTDYSVLPEFNLLSDQIEHFSFLTATRQHQSISETRCLDPVAEIRIASLQITRWSRTPWMENCCWFYCRALC